MGKFYVYTSRASKGARALAKALGGKRLRSPTVMVWPHFYPTDTFINWGDSSCPMDIWEGPTTVVGLNSPSSIRLVANKSLAFDAFSAAGVPIPAFARRREDVTWQGSTVVRHKLTGHSGEGIEICSCPPNELPDAPLYVQYIKKQDEYRIHVGRRGDEITSISIQRKARRHDTPDSEVNWQVRNHSNGFVFVRSGVNPPQAVMDAAKQALVASGLDFGAVDVIYNKAEKKAYVLEINTAPGLEGTTLVDYANFFRGGSE